MPPTSKKSTSQRKPPKKTKKPSEEFWDVEEILETKIIKGSQKYLVKWKNWRKFGVHFGFLGGFIVMNVGFWFEIWVYWGVNDVLVDFYPLVDHDEPGQKRDLLKLA